MSRSLLIADDSNTIRKVVELTFRDTEFVVDCASDGDQATRALDRGHHDVVLAGVLMTGTDGYELCRRIKSSTRPVPVLLLAGTFEPFDHDRARECGADGCLLKPFDSQTLLDRVRTLLTERDAARSGAIDTDRVQEDGPAVGTPTPAAGEIDRASEIASTPTSPGSASLGEDQIRRIVDQVSAQVYTAVSRRLEKEIVPRIAESVVRQHLLRQASSTDE